MSPFRSEKQRRYLWKKHPDIAEGWTEEYGSKVKPKKKTKKKTTKKKTKRSCKHGK